MTVPVGSERGTAGIALPKTSDAAEMTTMRARANILTKEVGSTGDRWNELEYSNPKAGAIYTS